MAKSATERDPQVSFRVRREIFDTLTQLADGETLYQFMPQWVEDMLSGEAITRLTQELADARRVNGNLERENQGMADRMFAAEDTVKTLRQEAVDTTMNVERLRAKLGTESQKVQALQLQNVELLTENGVLRDRLKRVIDKAVQNSFVTRKTFEAL
ncbi:hypothetical protein [Fibrella aquatilis]|uniref:Uncharacterized protein n=1 Tax=Fibrella aquatilis TaxID=2817059 RepID=A0A939G5V6_9BACT|nr:hypothetical protein [Fibrella aquatilis]MBO0930348.1 hypothetical protein [Fibrella aquatilis]